MATTEQASEEVLHAKGAINSARAPIVLDKIITRESADGGATGGTQSHSLRAPQLFASRKERKLIAGLLLALATVALYTPVMRAPFLNYDDAAYVTENSHVRDGLSWNTVVWAFQSTEQWTWQPITWLSHALDCQIFGVNPAGPHAVSMFFHAINAVLLFLILASATGFFWRSLAVATLFALYPINVESVAWIAERKSVLGMLFFLLALAAYGWYARRPGVRRYVVVTIAYALALMSKPQLITFPFALLLLDYWPLRRMAGDNPETQQAASRPICLGDGGCSFWRLVCEKLPWFAMSAASAVITTHVEASATRMQIPLSLQLENAALSYAKYLGKTFWPVNLALLYPHPMFSINVAGAMAAAIGIIGVTVLAVVFRRYRPFFVGWFWFVGTLVPTIGLARIGVHGMADRLAYIPLLGIFVIVCWGVGEFVAKWQIPRKVAVVGAAIVLLSLGVALHRQVSFWSSNLRLWAHTVEITDNNYTAEDNLATALLADGRIAEAMPHFQQARLYRPDDVMATLNLAVWDQMRGRNQSAADGYTNVLLLTKVPGLIALAHINRGYARYLLKQYAGAQLDFKAAAEQSGNSAAYRGLGLVAQRDGDIREAAKNYARSVELQPSPVGYLLVAQALKITGDSEAASVAKAKADLLTRDPTHDLAALKLLLAN